MERKTLTLTVQVKWPLNKEINELYYDKVEKYTSDRFTLSENEREPIHRNSMWVVNLNG